MRGQIQIVKKAADDNPITKDKAGAFLDGAEFTIYNDKLEVVDVIVTENGVATSKPLPLNTYAIKETSSPEYYRTVRCSMPHSRWRMTWYALRCSMKVSM